jgi:hypothetical protein
LTNPEHLEKARQAIMRYRELLDLMHQELKTAETYYTRLFDNCSDEDKATLPDKELQRRAAHDVIADPKPLQDAALHMRFVSRDFEREFENVHDNLIFEESD